MPFYHEWKCVLVLCTTFHQPASPPSIISESALVFCVQVNFIKGGLMLTTVTQHNVDMTGHDFALNMLSKDIQKRVISEDLTMRIMNLSLAIWQLGDFYRARSSSTCETSPSTNETKYSTLPAQLNWPGKCPSLVHAMTYVYYQHNSKHMGH